MGSVLRTLLPYGIVLLLLSNRVSAQNCFSTGLNGKVINLPCNVNCTPFQFKVPHLKSTSEYTIVDIPFAPMLPYTTPGGTEVTSIYSDDKFSTVYPLPFPFCFYDTTFTQFVVGSNGLISFDIANADCSNAWLLETATNSGIPVPLPFMGAQVCSNSTGPKYPAYSVMSPYHDINPNVTSGTPDRKIEWRVVGSAPCRKLIVSFYNIALFGQNSKLNTSQMVLYESTGIIDIFVKDKALDTDGSVWNGNRAIIGIQKNAQKAATVPGKNATIFEMHDSAYRFIPSGAGSRFIKAELWDMNGTVLATTGVTAGADTATSTPGLLDLNFPQQCPPGANTQYIVKTYYATCEGAGTLISSDTVTVNKTTSLNATISDTIPSACGPNGSFKVNIPSGVGTLPYTLVLDGGTPITLNAQTYTFSGLLGGPHTLVITTADGCSQTLNVNIRSSGVLTINMSTTATTCNGASNGTITVSPQNGVSPFQYSINSGAYVSFNGPSHTITGLPKGTYFVSIKDASGCQKDNILAIIDGGPALTININAVAPACPGASNGTITVTPTAGTGPYTYSINNNPFQSGNTFSNLASGTYFISVQDAIGCFVNNVFATVGVSTGSLNATANATGTSCSGVSNGSITIVPANGSAPYQYSTDGGTTWHPGLTITGLAPGSYSVMVKDAGGCVSAAIPATVSQGNALLATTATTPTSCTGVSNGTITVTPSNGSGPYTYQLDGGTPQSSATFTGVSAGSHAVIVTDGAGCVSNSISVTVAVGPAITGTATTTATSCNGALNGTVTVTPTNGVLPHTYSIDGGSYQSSNTFTGVSAGNHIITIKDAAGCTSNGINVTVVAGPALTGTAASSPTSCTGVNNGGITVTPTNGTGPFEYSLDGGSFQSGNIFSGVSAGAHNVVIRNSLGCTTNAIPVTVTVGPAITGTATAIATSCNGATDGGITVTATPGIGQAPLTYQLDGGSFQSSNSFSNVAPGSHTVVIKDAVGCSSAPITVNVTVGQALTGTISTTPTSCSGAINGTITLTTSNGSGPFQYSIDGVNFQASNTFTGLATGNYTITWKNGTGCQSTIQATVNPGQPLTATIGTNNVLCNGGTSGVAVVTISVNGAPPYQYSLDGSTWQASNTFNGLAAGAYTVYFKDQNNCSGNKAFTITQPTPLTIAPAQQAAFCSGQNNGSILVGASGGTAPYQYSVDGSNYQAGNNFSVAAGNYTVYVRDNNNCVRSQQVVVTEPLPLTATAVPSSATCDNLGTLSINASGGSSSYQYAIDGGNYQTSNSFNATPGIHTVVIKDGNGCSISRSATITLVNNLTVTPVADETICEGLSVQLKPSSNANQFAWTTLAGSSAGNVEKPTVTPSTTTDYVVKATLGVCSSTDTIRVNVLPAPVADAGLDGDICYGQSFQLNGSGGVSFEWSPSTFLSSAVSNTPVVTPDKTTQYALSVVDANGCRSLQPDMVTVKVIPPIIVRIGKDSVVSMGDVIQLHASSVATNYYWSPGYGLDDPTKPDPRATVTGDITYTVLATTAAGCKGEASITLKVYEGPEIYMVTGFTPNGDGKNDVFKPFPVGIKSYTYFRVFNRWGQLIFETKEFNKGWDGKINGKDQPAGTYVWMVEGITKDDRKISKKGTVVLIR